jgi:hypothetical protein
LGAVSAVGWSNGKTQIVDVRRKVFGAGSLWHNNAIKELQPFSSENRGHSLIAFLELDAT